MFTRGATYFYPGMEHLEKIISDFALEAEKRLGYKPNTVINFWFGYEEREDECTEVEKMSDL